LDSRQFRTNEGLTRAIREVLPPRCNVFTGAAGKIEGLRIKHSPNSSIDGPVTFPEDLRRDGYNIALVNDMGAAVSAVVLWGPGRDRRVSAVGTYSSGSNFAVSREGLLISMEASHMQGPAVAGWPNEVPLFAQVWQYCFRRNVDFSSAPVAIEGMKDYNSKHSPAQLARLGLSPLTSEDLATQDGLARALFALSYYPDSIVLNDRTFTAAELTSDARLICGCEGRGHLEPLVTGNGAAWMAQRHFLLNREPGHKIMLMALADYNKKFGTNIAFSSLVDDSIYPVIVSHISAKHVYEAYRLAPEEMPQAFIRNTQVDMIAASIGILASYHMPEVLVCMGSMTNDWDIIFEPAIALITPGSPVHRPGHYCLDAITPPEVLKNDIEELGLVGAVAYGVMQEKR